MAGVLDTSRPCGSKTRAKNRYTRDELLSLAKENEVAGYSKMNMDQLCAALGGEEEEPGAGAPRKVSPKRKASPKRKKASPKPKKAAKKKVSPKKKKKASPKPKKSSLKAVAPSEAEAKELVKEVKEETKKLVRFASMEPAELTASEEEKVKEGMEALEDIKVAQGEIKENKAELKRLSSNVSEFKKVIVKKPELARRVSLEVVKEEKKVRPKSPGRKAPLRPDEEKKLLEKAQKTKELLSQIRNGIRDTERDLSSLRLKISSVKLAVSIKGLRERESLGLVEKGVPVLEAADKQQASAEEQVEEYRKFFGGSLPGVYADVEKKLAASKAANENMRAAVEKAQAFLSQLNEERELLKQVEESYAKQERKLNEDKAKLRELEEELGEVQEGAGAGKQEGCKVQ